MEKPNVYFTKKITSDSLVKIFLRLNTQLKGRVGVKISTGELGGNNYLKPKLIGELIKKVNGTVVECNTAYAGARNSTLEHLMVAKKHGFTSISEVDIMDSEGEMEIPTNGKHMHVNIVGSHLANYDSILNLAHFKGHAMGGFGGVIKNQSIGIASRNGKAYIHSAGCTRDPNILWDNLPSQNDFLESMAEAAKSIKDYIDKKGGNILYINVMNNLSVDCDCDASPEDPCMKDIGILSSTDPVALDKACLDKIWATNDKGRDHFIKRVERQNGRYIIPYAESIGLGNSNYNLIDIDEEYND